MRSPRGHTWQAWAFASDGCWNWPDSSFGKAGTLSFNIWLAGGFPRADNGAKVGIFRYSRIINYFINKGMVYVTD